MDAALIRKIIRAAERRIALAEKEGDEKELMILDMEWEDNEILKGGYISGYVDEEDLY